MATEEAKNAASAFGDVKVVLGTMEMGRPKRETQTAEASHKLVDIFLNAGGQELDTALMYCNGKTEQILGTYKPKEKTPSIATKVNPWQAPWKSLTAESVKQQLAKSLASLKTSQVDILYLHAPDHTNPLEDTLKALNELHKEGKFLRLGLSNYASWEVVDVWHICDRNGWIKPTVYQGMYNAFTRGVESELFPALRRCGIQFYAYNPLAGGILTGRYKYEDTEQKKPEGRFFGNSWAEKYRDRFWHKSYFDALELVKQALDKAYPQGGVSCVDAALRWTLHHSEMGRGDALILGASSESHLVQNLKACKAGPLEAGVVKALDEGWLLCKAQCASYFRSNLPQKQ